MSILNGAISGKLIHPAVPQLLSRLEGLGSARRAAFYRDILYISTRAGGLDMVDVREPLAPRHIGTLDTLELATGVSAA